MVLVEHLEGKARVFGDDIDTDQIIQGRYLQLLDYTEMAKHTFEVIRPDFVRVASKGDIVVAGCNFGSGSSREEAPMVLKTLGISCVIAESFSRIFYRNAFNIGLPALVVKELSKQVREDMDLAVNLIKGEVTLKETGSIFYFSRIPTKMLELLRAGGAVAWYRQTSSTERTSQS